MESSAVQTQIDLRKPVSFIHQTSDGPVHLVVRASKAGWMALFWDRKEAEAWTFRTMAEANQSVLLHFREVYLAHRCSAGCGPVDVVALHKSDDVWGMIRE